MSKMTNGELLREFKDRFLATTLYNWQISSMLTIIGIDGIKIYLKEIGFRVVKISEKK